MEPLVLPITKPAADFEKYLTIEQNDRIIFSGIFGSGKTYFLKNFFKEKKDKYVPIHIFPTNYSVASNEDIFELIKYDILYQLICLRPYLEKVTASDLEAIPFLKFTEAKTVLRPFVESIPKIGKYINQIADSLIQLKKIIDKKRKEIETDEGKEIAEYIETFKDLQGSIYENDFYTELIKDLIKRVSEGKTVVLIVDDLDRIDPEHIFRILNVFAVHLNVEQIENGQNKFGFGKIILCCDVANIRAIFKARYGQAVDFSGYIDKFYSQGIYAFDNQKIVIDSVQKVLMSLKYGERFKQLSYWANPDTRYFGFLRQLICMMILSNSLNLRKLAKLYNMPYEISIYSIQFEGRALKNVQMPIITVFDFLLHLFDDIESLRSALQKTDFVLEEQGSDFMHTNFISIFPDLVAIVDNRNGKFVSNQNLTANHITPISPIPYNLKSDHHQMLDVYVGHFGKVDDNNEKILPIVSLVGLSLFKETILKAFDCWTVAKQGTYRK